MPKITVTTELEVPYGLVEAVRRGERDACDEMEERIQDHVTRGGLDLMEIDFS